MARGRRKQQDLPAEGMSTQERPEIEEPAEDLRIIQGEIVQLNERKRGAKQLLLDAMTAAGIAIHKYLDPDGIQRTARKVDTSKVVVERSRTQKAEDEDTGGVEVS